LSDLPKRKHQFTADLGADSVDDLAQALEQIARDLRESGNKVVTGAPHWGGHWEHRVDPKQTAEGYSEQLEEYLDEKAVEA
jgi:poly-gamma-glutamate capsule biosynthesis protein CapA/YwtB (metallophosphatase superfamily)